MIDFNMLQTRSFFKKNYKIVNRLIQILNYTNKQLKNGKIAN